MAPRQSTAPITLNHIDAGSLECEAEVICPLFTQDGKACGKKCIGEKRFRSMQEHIRRAHPLHHIPKLPATEASFWAMVNQTPSEKPPAMSVAMPPKPEHANATLGQSFVPPCAKQHTRIGVIHGAASSPPLFDDGPDRSPTIVTHAPDLTPALTNQSASNSPVETHARVPPVLNLDLATFTPELPIAPTPTTPGLVHSAGPSAEHSAAASLVRSPSIDYQGWTGQDFNLPLMMPAENSFEMSYPYGASMSEQWTNFISMDDGCGDKLAPQMAKNEIGIIGQDDFSMDEKPPPHSAAKIGLHAMSPNLKQSNFAAHQAADIREAGTQDHGSLVATNGDMLAHISRHGHLRSHEVQIQQSGAPQPAASMLGLAALSMSLAAAADVPHGISLAQPPLPKSGARGPRRKSEPAKPGLEARQSRSELQTMFSHLSSHLENESTSENASSESRPRHPSISLKRPRPSQGKDSINTLLDSLDTDKTPKKRLKSKSWDYKVNNNFGGGFLNLGTSGVDGANGVLGGLPDNFSGALDGLNIFGGTAYPLIVPGAPAQVMSEMELGVMAQSTDKAVIPAVTSGFPSNCAAQALPVQKATAQMTSPTMTKKGYQCPHCPSRFVGRTDFNEHLSTHSHSNGEHLGTNGDQVVVNENAKQSRVSKAAKTEPKLQPAVRTDPRTIHSPAKSAPMPSWSITPILHSDVCATGALNQVGVARVQLEVPPGLDIGNGQGQKRKPNEDRDTNQGHQKQSRQGPSGFSTQPSGDSRMASFLIPALSLSHISGPLLTKTQGGLPSPVNENPSSPLTQVIAVPVFEPARPTSQKKTHPPLSTPSAGITTDSSLESASQQASIYEAHKMAPSPGLSATATSLARPSHQTKLNAILAPSSSPSFSVASSPFVLGQQQNCVLEAMRSRLARAEAETRASRAMMQKMDALLGQFLDCPTVSGVAAAKNMPAHAIYEKLAHLRGEIFGSAATKATVHAVNGQEQQRPTSRAC